VHNLFDGAIDGAVVRIFYVNFNEVGSHVRR
jgi:hypothetical protein